jgi:serine/threonine protein kinase
MMNFTQKKHRTLFAPDLAATIAEDQYDPASVKDLTRSDSWLSRGASQESTALVSHKSVRVHSQVKTFDSSPFHQHERSYQTDLAGTVAICVNTRTKKEFAIKEVPNCTKLQIQQLKPAIHESIVQFSAAYYFKDSIYLVYERMLVSLGEIYATPKGHIPDTGIALVSSSILKGLAYVHENLNMSHGAINGENILLNSLGQVKIGKYTLMF